MFLGILAVIVGAVWLLNNLGVVSYNVWSIVLPAAVILAGIIISGRHCRCGKCWFCKSKGHHGECHECCEHCEVKNENKQ